jgi:carbon-monoxide dehydrogenase large subunit
VRVAADAKVTVLTGTSYQGQGGETAFAQLVAEELGVSMDDVTVVHSDTDKVPFGIGSSSSRGVAVGGSAVFMSIEKVKEKARRIGAHLLGAELSDLHYGAGNVFVKGQPDRAVSLREVAATAWRAMDLPPGEEPGLEASSYFMPTNYCFPFGTHIALVEVHADTGKTELMRYIAVDDCGKVINRQIVEGQIHGGVVQGIASALMEEVVYDQDGQLLTGSLMDYNIPKAEDLPSFEVEHTVTPTDSNPLGAKGIGEGGTIAAPAAVANAVIDALAPFGVDHVDMMMRPEKIWRLMQLTGDGGSA